MMQQTTIKHTWVENRGVMWCSKCKEIQLARNIDGMCSIFIVDNSIIKDLDYADIEKKIFNDPLYKEKVSLIEEAIKKVKDAEYQIKWTQFNPLKY